jgi:hexokinase
MQQSELQQIAENFTNEIRAAASGKPSSLPFIINELPATSLVAEGQTFQVMGLGGTIFRSAFITKTANGLQVSNPLERSHPLFATKDAFLSFVAENLHPTTELLAINFAQALDPVFENGKLDGKLAAQTKEHKFDGLLGQKVCAELEHFIEQQSGRKVRITVANDTICLMLSGLTQYPADSLAAGIIGTGLNFAIFLDKTHAVNLEAGQFNKFTPSPETEIVDKYSEKPGNYIWEKEIAGAYLHQHFNLQLQENHIKYPSIANTRELDTVIRQEIPNVSNIALDVMHTSAQLAGAMMSGILKFYGKDVTFVMQGSLFWKGYDYKTTVENTIKELVPEYKATFVHIEYADYLGAAKLLA